MSDNTRGDLVARLTALVDSLPEERVQELLGMEDDALLALLTGDTDEEAPSEEAPATKPAHQDVRIEFELAGQMFEAVGFLKKGEESVRGEEALRRVDNGRLLKSEEDWQCVYEHRGELPKELNPYWLATARPILDNPRDVSILCPGAAGWYDVWGRLGGQWRRGVLVLRRRVS